MSDVEIPSSGVPEGGGGGIKRQDVSDMAMMIMAISLFFFAYAIYENTKVRSQANEILKENTYRLKWNIQGDCRCSIDD